MANPYLRVAMDNARSLQLELNTQRDAVTNKIADVILLRNFLSAWDEDSYEAALETLPQDNPDTPNVDEGMSEEEFQNKAETILGKDWESITPDEDLSSLQAKVRLYLGQQSDLRSRADNVEDDIANLTALQEAEANDPSSSSGNIPDAPT